MFNMNSQFKVPQNPLEVLLLLNTVRGRVESQLQDPLLPKPLLFALRCTLEKQSALGSFQSNVLLKDIF